MAGRSRFGEIEQERVLALLRAGAKVEDVAAELECTRRTISRMAGRDDDFGREVRALIRARKNTRKRITAQRKQVRAAATVAALAPEERVEVEVIVPEVLQTPQSRVRDGDRELGSTKVVGRVQLLELLSTALLDDESPLHVFAAQALFTYHFSSEIEAAKIEAKARATENALARRARRSGPSTSLSRSRVSELFRRRRELPEATAEGDG